MFDPPCLRKNLAMFELMLSNNLACVVKDHESSTTRALIQTADICHDAQPLAVS
jgi:hypothetical protein